MELFNVFINGEIEAYNYRILNLLRQEVENGNIYNTEFRIDIRDYLGELFILQINHDKGTTSTRLLKR